MDIINYILAALSIGFGMLGWLATDYTLKVVDLQDGGSTMGRSEVRAASGALFVGLGVGALILGTPAAYMMIGFAWGGGAVGRLTSIIIDGQTPKKWGFFASEAAVLIIAVWNNL
ncbi:DUF4345 family protein [Aestuariibius sp. 2305UL40-4]|uniref:DUF4345 family protein n=1 Tax=Aestuariibius violaceus TaxID=3234132 RepID=UPI00345EF47D